MSILLDALKKSEQERQLGQVPTLQSRPDELPGGREPLNPWILLSMVLLSVGVMAWFGWRQFQHLPGKETPVVAIETGVGEPPPAESPPTEAAPQARTKTESFQLENERRLPMPMKPKASGARAARDRGAAARSVSDFKAESDETAPAEPSENPVAAGEPVAGQVSGPLAVETGAPAAADEEKPRRGIEPHVVEPISFWELPQGIRDDLPEIKITVLVYAEHPGDRFLLTNGQRMVEKDELEGGLVLDEIRKDGAVFLYRNYRFLVKS